MGQPTWREIWKISVPNETGNAWTAALDYVTSGKLYKIVVASKEKWTPESGTACNADGDATLTRSSAVILDTSSVGALIARIGGSTADLKPDKDKLMIFSVGRHCVFSVTDPLKTGSLYLAVNDTPSSQSKLEGKLEVSIHESL